MEKEIRFSKDRFYTIDYQRFILAGDIGGTNAYFAIMGVKDIKAFEILIKYFMPSKDITSIAEVINTILKEVDEEYGIKIGIGCIGVAGAVDKRREEISLTNIDLVVSSADLLSNTRLKRVILLNDFEAIGYGVSLLDMEKHVMKLRPDPEMPLNSVFVNTFAVIGAGTGLGISIVPYNKVKHLHIPLPSEGGHTDFAPADELEVELFNFLKENVLTNKEAIPCYERLLSGPGMDNIFTFFVRKIQGNETETVKNILTMSGTKKMQEIEGNYNNDETCRKTIDMFIKLYARAAKNVALMSSCYSGLFITGRIALKNADRFKEPKFVEEFERADKRAEMLKRIPLYIISNIEVGLYGCCNVAVNFFNIT